MKSRLSILIISLLLLLTMGTGCIGNFGLSGKVRKFNLDVSQDRWGREIVFVVLYVVPVYPFAGFLDMIVFNSIEFWTGTNPIDGSASVTPVAMNEWTTEDGTKVTMRGLPDKSIDVNVVRPDGEASFFNLTRTDEGVTARDEAGNVIISAADLPMDLLEGRF
ncbi:MAG: DUF3332 family protein [Deltaproteobacteria bacterium]|nr:DUF3332 family protein [Deltaproteobacteria bacterium]